MAKRLRAMGSPKYENGFQLALHEDVLELPLRWRKPRTIFVNSMSDLFHQRVPDEFILRVFQVMQKASWHRFQVLTKRPERLLTLNEILPWSPNIWMGVSIETDKYVYRIDMLRRTKAHLKFLSLEPLLGPLPNLDLSGIHWAIVGGESGPKARAMEEEWAVDIRDQCLSAGVAFFFKQWGGVHRRNAGRILQGRTWDELPGPQ